MLNGVRPDGSWSISVLLKLAPMVGLVTTGAASARTVTCSATAAGAIVTSTSTVRPSGTRVGRLAVAMPSISMVMTYSPGGSPRTT